MFGKLNLGSQCTVLPETDDQIYDPIEQQLTAAIESPSGFPRLADSIVPGDRIAIAVSHQIPQVAELLVCLIDYLTDHQIEADDITIVLPTIDYIERTSDPDDPAWQKLMDHVRITTLRTDDPDRLAFLAPDRNGNPIYVSRDLFDADMVIPILRNDGLLQSENRREGIVPDYCFRERVVEAQPSGQRTDNDFDADEVNDQLGVFFICEVIVGPGNQIKNIIAGNRRDIGVRRQ